MVSPLVSGNGGSHSSRVSQAGYEGQEANFQRPKGRVGDGGSSSPYTKARTLGPFKSMREPWPPSRMTIPGTSPSHPPRLEPLLGRGACWRSMIHLLQILRPSPAGPGAKWSARCVIACCLDTSAGSIPFHGEGAALGPLPPKTLPLLAPTPVSAWKGGGGEREGWKGPVSLRHASPYRKDTGCRVRSQLPRPLAPPPPRPPRPLPRSSAEGGGGGDQARAR
jgi:hypothetical protein